MKYSAAEKLADDAFAWAVEIAARRVENADLWNPKLKRKTLKYLAKEIREIVDGVR